MGKGLIRGITNDLLTKVDKGKGRRASIGWPRED